MDPLDRVTDRLDRLASSGPAKQARSVYQEFKQFAFKGNVVDLAIGVVIGAAFGKIVDSLVKNVLMPLIAAVTPGDGGYTRWKVAVNGSEVLYGQFLGEVVNFLIVAVALFVFVRFFLRWVARAKADDEAPPPTKDQELLTEIRDLLKAHRPG